MICHTGSSEKFIPVSAEKEGETVERVFLVVFLSCFPVQQGQTHLLVSLNAQVMIAVEELQDKDMAVVRAHKLVMLYRGQQECKGGES